MSRPLRIQYPNAWYHVMNRGRRGEAVFQSENDYKCFLEILHEALDLFSLRVSPYCLMNNYYHLLVQTPDANQFINTVKERFFTQKRHTEVPESKRMAPDTKDILNAVCDFYGINKAQLFTTKRGTINEARNMAIYLLRYLKGDSLTTIGKVFNIQSYSTVGSIIERFKVRMQMERKLIRKVEGIRKATMSQEKI